MARQPRADGRNPRTVAAGKYNARAYEDIRFRVCAGGKAEIQAAAMAAGQSVNSYITQAIRERMDRDRVQ